MKSKLYSDMHRGILKRLLISSLILSLVLFPAQPASATSAVDNVIIPTNTLTIVNPTFYECASTAAGTKDLSATWAIEFRKSLSGATLESFDNRKAWTVSLNQAEVGWGVYPTQVHIGWWETQDLPVTATFGSNYLTGPSGKRGTLRIDWDNCALVGTILSDGLVMIASNDPVPPTSITLYPFLSHNVEVDYPAGYAGASLPSINSTSDTDGDGLSDYIESPYYPLRDNIFCKVNTTDCAYPNPNKKDLYLEIDSIQNGSVAHTPTATQLALVESKFLDLNINFHADTGQYGGGNIISRPSGELDVMNDFYPLKYGNSTQSPNFNTNRYKIWRYMISGHNFTDGTTPSTTSSGKSEAGRDDLYLSHGLLTSNQSSLPSGLDDGIAGTIIHELGHSLCLTSNAYVGQSTNCLFSGIDTNLANDNYRSAMNYNHQYKNLYSFSDGSMTNDHDDISAINVGFDDFQSDDDSAVGGPQ